MSGLGYLIWVAVLHTRLFHAVQAGAQLLRTAKQGQQQRAANAARELWLAASAKSDLPQRVVPANLVKQRLVGNAR